MTKFLSALALSTSLLAAPAAFAADAYKFDPSHSQLLFSYNHLGFSTNYGLFSGFNGEAVIDSEDLSKSSVKVELSVSDMIMGWEPRKNDLLSQNFFNAAVNPTATFISTKVEPTGDKTAKITGDLTIAGTTKEVVLDATLNQIGENPVSKKPWAGFAATTVLKRSDFGVEKFAPYVSDEVNITISVEMEKTS
jgi:polyisoprenoid-binding protein YceI